MKIYAVVDTNVIVSALITKNPQSPPNLVLREMLDGKISVTLPEGSVIAIENRDVSREDGRQYK